MSLREPDGGQQYDGANDVVGSYRGGVVRCQGCFGRDAQSQPVVSHILVVSHLFY